MITLGLSPPVKYHWVQFAENEGLQPYGATLDQRDTSKVGLRTRITITQNGNGRAEAPIAKISPGYLDMLNPNGELPRAQARRLAQLYAFILYGGTEKQYKQLQSIADLMKNGDEAACLPPGIQVERNKSLFRRREEVVVRRSEPNKEVLRVDTSDYHKDNLPRLLPKGLDLGAISLALSLNLPKGLIQQAAVATANYHNNRSKPY